ncbi:succinate-CoA ligase [Penicillium cinerascens]|uniref:Succinate--CoA ligase [ADP-forming] subunit beta, mitochondrial n=1 Tax=Penicillium cinerascens TaxID=70096 RepID=A0A9W9MNI7_9EURO|nr:succinate-CoA ligase [Penicillium cinerascens]KAJ5204612.1 succinate-CoA ligase [Penicillium cinerascens]
MSFRRPTLASLRVALKIRPAIPRRYLSIHEYQAQGLLREYDIPVPRGQVAHSPTEVFKAIEEIGGRCVVKSQIQKGGRGKGSFDNGLQGGIQIVDTPHAGQQVASKMLGSRLRTKQTYQKGLKVDTVYVAEAISYDEEWYLAMTIDREHYSPAVILSRSGGVDIEKIAKEEPENLHKFHFSLTKGISAELIDEISQRVGISDKERDHLSRILIRMHEVFTSKDATLLEINPLVRFQDGSFTCLDAKFTFDNTAKKRQPALFDLRDVQHEVIDEIEAEKAGLVYVRMDGSIGNVVNGAGLAMATNDAISYYGGTSANFLDTGGQVTKEAMQTAFEIIMRDERVKAILINIYGGIIRCDMIAECIIAAAKALGPSKVPVVVRLQGTNSQKGLEMLEDAQLDLHIESDFGVAAQKAVELANVD